jgi:hypothetical protein
MHFTGWGTLQSVAAVNTAAHDGCPIESPDGLSLYIASNRDGFTGAIRNLDIWVSTRASKSDPWGTPQNLGAPVNSAADDFCPTPIRGNGLFFVSRKPGGCGLGDIYFSRRNPTHGWSEPERLACTWAGGPNSDLDEQGPSYVENGARDLLFFSRSRTPAQGGLVPGEIFVSERLSDGFGLASLIPELSSPGNDIQPNVRKDGLEMVFSSSYGYQGHQGSQDIYASTRESITDPWSAPSNLGPNVNTPDSETRPSLSWDGQTLYLGRTPPTGPPGDVHVTTREKLNGK